MPNIEIYGLQFESEEKVKNLTDNIHQLFDGKPYQENYVITNVLSDARSYKWCSCPFLRICTTNTGEELEDILNTLLILEMDMEVLILHRFIPKKS
jgi:hypothetical protein